MKILHNAKFVCVTHSFSLTLLTSAIKTAGTIRVNVIKHYVRSVAMTREI